MEEQEKRQANRKSMFVKQLGEKVRWVASSDCWGRPGNRLNEVLKAGHTLGFWTWSLLSDEQCNELEALHTLKAFDELKTTVVEMLDLKTRFPEIA